MSFIKIPMKGMSDVLPQEMKLREYVIKIIGSVCRCLHWRCCFIF
jgi:histidyl-tRNA synthetase